MRTGDEYRQALRDGRRVWVVGDGLIKDVTLHPATRPMVDEYVAWYDRHLDPAWQDVVLTPPDERGERTPWAFALPRTAADLRAMGRSYSATVFLTAGNMTHTPGYGNLIALGILEAVQQRKVSQDQIASATRYRDLIARTGRFLTFAAGAAPIGYRLREDPRERAALRIVRETDTGLVLRGKVAMHTSPAYAEDVYIGSHSGVDRDGHRATFVVAVNAPGVTVVCRKVSARHPNPYLSPLSSRFDELDGQMWLDDVLVPWERIFLTEPSPEPIASWLFWHQLYCWLAKAEFTLGLALACADAMGLREQEPTIEYLIDLVTDVQTVRSCLTAAELDPGRSEEGYCVPGGAHIAAGSIAMQKARQRMAEILRDPSRLIARGRAGGHGPGGARGRRGARGVVRRRRVHGASARGPAPACRGPRRLGPGRPRVRIRATRQRRAPCLARAAPPLFRQLQRAGQWRACRPEPRDAGDRPGQPARDAAAAAATSHAAAPSVVALRHHDPERRA